MGNQQFIKITNFVIRYLGSLGSCISWELCPYEIFDILSENNLNVRKGAIWKQFKNVDEAGEQNTLNIIFNNLRTVKQSIDILEWPIVCWNSISLVLTSFESFHFSICHNKHEVMWYFLANACSLPAAGYENLKRSQTHLLLPKPCCFLSPV